MHESDIPELIEVLASFAYKWKLIGTHLGFTQHELKNIEYHKKEPTEYLTDMLSEWVQWTPDGPHRKYARFHDLCKALQSRTVGLENGEAHNVRMQILGKYVYLIMYIYNDKCTNLDLSKKIAFL